MSDGICHLAVSPHTRPLAASPHARPLAASPHARPLAASCPQELESLRREVAALKELVKVKDGEGAVCYS